MNSHNAPVRKVNQLTEVMHENQRPERKSIQRLELRGPNFVFRMQILRTSFCPYYARLPHLVA